MNFRNPKSKVKHISSRLANYSPFPIPVASLTGKPCDNSRWYSYEGRLAGDYVLVRNEGDMGMLYSMGFFGKGNLSRGKPNYQFTSKSFQQSVKRKRLPNQIRRKKQCDFKPIRQEKYKRHKQWREEYTRYAAESCSKFGADRNILHLNRSGNLDVDDCSTEDNSSTKDESVTSYHDDQKLCRKEGEESIKDELTTLHHYSMELDKESLSTEMQSACTQLSDDGCSDQSEDGCTVSHCDVKLANKLLDVETNTAIDCKGCKESESVTSCNVRRGVKLDSSKGIKLKKIREDPYTIYEYLQLTLEEAFFLVFSFNCLKIMLNEDTLNVYELWKQFLITRKTFLPKYIAYHYYRSRGWVPKCGIKYGTDFLLYHRGPEFYHSSYAVLVQLGDKQDNSDSKAFNWTTLTTLSRVNEHAAKDLLICYVIKPMNLSDDELSNPSCITKFTVKEILIRRWVCEKSRQDVTSSNKMENFYNIDSE